MPAYKPEDCDRLLYELIESGDLEAAVNLYEPDAVFIVPPGKRITGQDAIREVLESMTTGQSTGKLESVASVTSSDGTLAFTRSSGTSTNPGPDGKLTTTHFHSVEVLRKQPDGSWRIVIDDPRGIGLD